MSFSHSSSNSERVQPGLKTQKRLQSISAQEFHDDRQVWSRSTGRSPCSICDRRLDDKCRRKADLIDSWVGDRFRPPFHLSIGDVMKVEVER